MENLYGTTEQQTKIAQNFPGRAARADYTTNCTCPQFVPLSIVPGFARRLQVPTNAIALVAELPYNRRLCAWVQIRCRSGANQVQIRCKSGAALGTHGCV